MVGSFSNVWNNCQSDQYQGLDWVLDMLGKLIWSQSGIRLALLKGYIFKYYKYDNLNVKSLKVVRYSVVQQCGLRPLNAANPSHKHVVQYCSPRLLCQRIKPLNTNSEKRVSVWVEGSSISLWVISQFKDFSSKTLMGSRRAGWSSHNVFGGQRKTSVTFWQSVYTCEKM